MSILYIVMPAYNEEENIENVVKKWYRLLEGKGENSRVVVADSGSNDKTHEILLKMQKQGFEKLEILEGTDKKHGPKVFALYNYAIKNGAEYIFQTDSDDQTDPAEFDPFWQLRNSYDGIFGNRINRGDGRQRAFVEKVVCFLLKIYFGVDVPDANAPFRLMKADVVNKYLYKLDKDYNLPNIMISTYFAYNNEKICFLPISFKPRQMGKNSIDMKKIVKIGWKSLRDFYQFRKDIDIV